MKKHGLLTFICLALIFVATTESSSDSDTKAGEILMVQGSVYLIRDARENDARPRMQVLLKDSVETGRKSRAKLFFIDDSILNLGELSRMKVTEYFYRKEKKKSKSIYTLIKGSLKMVVGNSDLEIHTPTAVAAARGTKFIVWVEGSGDDMFTGVITLESEVVVRNKSQGIAGEVIVKSGRMSRVYVHKPPESVQEVDIEIIRRFNDRNMVIGNTIKDTEITPRKLPTPSANGLHMLTPPVSQEPVTDTPVLIEMIYPN